MFVTLVLGPTRPSQPTYVLNRRHSPIAHLRPPCRLSVPMLAITVQASRAPIEGALGRETADWIRARRWGALRPRAPSTQRSKRQSEQVTPGHQWYTGRRLGSETGLMPWFPRHPNLACTNEVTPYGESPEATRPDTHGHTAESTAGRHRRPHGQTPRRKQREEQREEEQQQQAGRYHRGSNPGVEPRVGHAQHIQEKKK